MAFKAFERKDLDVVLRQSLSCLDASHLDTKLEGPSIGSECKFVDFAAVRKSKAIGLEPGSMSFKHCRAACGAMALIDLQGLEAAVGSHGYWLDASDFLISGEDHDEELTGHVLPQYVQFTAHLATWASPRHSKRE